MVILDKISKDIVKAMKAKDSVRLNFLRLAKSEIIRAEVSSNNSVVKELRKMRKNSELMNNADELAILDEYLPNLMSEEDIEKAVDVIMFNAETKKLGDIMKLFGQAYKGKADNKIVSQVVRRKINGI